MSAFFIKFIITVSWLILVLIYLIIGLVRRNKKQIKTAGVIYLITIGGLLLVIAGQSFLPDKTKAYSGKRTVLVATRKASLGAVQLKVYTDSTYDLGSESKVTWRGRIKVSNDTLILLQNDKIAASFVVDTKVLKEVRNTGISFLQIESNNLIRAE